MGWTGGARSSAVLQGHAGTHGAHGESRLCADVVCVAATCCLVVCAVGTSSRTPSTRVLDATARDTEQNPEALNPSPMKT